MNGKTILQVASPLTQSVEAVKQLIEFATGELCQELPATFALANGARLTLSSKKDRYYYTTLQSCSCKAGENHKLCWHRRDLCEAARTKQKAGEVQDDPREASKQQARAYQARQRGLRRQAKAQAVVEEPTEGPRRLARPPEDERPHVAFKPFLEDEPRAAAGVV